MRYIIVLFVSVFLYPCLGQEETNSIYFPREQIIHPDCKNASDKNDCFYRIINDKVTEIINVNAKKIKTKNDSLAIKIELTVDINGNIKHDIEQFKFQNIRLGRKAIKTIIGLISNFPKTKVYNKKPEFYTSKHFFNYEYLANKSNVNQSFSPIPVKLKYKGGVVEENPIFPGCQGLSRDEGRKCFQMNMQNHIEKHFNYPEQAFRKGISGKVYLIMMIGKDGRISNLRTKGPHVLLENEAKRIMLLLPQFVPGRQNGKPVRVPYSIPITFRLN